MMHERRFHRSTRSGRDRATRRRLSNERLVDVRRVPDRLDRHPPSLVHHEVSVREDGNIDGSGGPRDRDPVRFVECVKVPDTGSYDPLPIWNAVAVTSSAE